MEQERPPDTSKQPRTPPRGRRALTIATSIPLAAIVFAFSLGPSPEKELQNFYQAQAADDGALAPLDRAGPSVVPLLIGEVTRRDMPRRRMAIRFLSRYRAALPALEAILTDEAEADEVRAEALRSIHRIDPRRAVDLAHLHQTRSDALGAVAKALGGTGVHATFPEAPSPTTD